MKNTFLSALLLMLAAFSVTALVKAQDDEEQGRMNRVSVFLTDFYVVQQYFDAAKFDALTTDDYSEERIDRSGTQKQTKTEILSELRRLTAGGAKKVFEKVDVKRQIAVFSAKEAGERIDYKYKLTEVSTLKINDAEREKLTKTERFDGNGMIVKRDGKWQLARLQRTRVNSPNIEQLRSDMDDAFRFDAALLAMVVDAVKPESVASDGWAKNNDEAQVLALATEFNNALVKRDAAALERLLSDDFFSPQLGSRQIVLDYFKTNADSPQGLLFTTINFVSSPRIHIYGDAATIWGVAQGKTREGGKEKLQSYHVTLTAVRRNGNWQIVMSHQSEFNSRVTNPLLDGWQIESFGAAQNQQAVGKELSLKFADATFTLTIAGCDPVNYDYTFEQTTRKVAVKLSATAANSCPKARQQYQELTEALLKVYEFKTDNDQLILIYDAGKVIRFKRAKEDSQSK